MSASQSTISSIVELLNAPISLVEHEDDYNRIQREIVTPFFQSVATYIGTKGKELLDSDHDITPQLKHDSKKKTRKRAHVGNHHNWAGNLRYFILLKQTGPPAGMKNGGYGVGCIGTCNALDSQVKG